MTKNINVNPDFYKTGGREHGEGHGEAVPHEHQKSVLNTHDNQPANRKAKSILSARKHSKKK